MSAIGFINTGSGSTGGSGDGTLGYLPGSVTLSNPGDPVQAVSLIPLASHLPFVSAVAAAMNAADLDPEQDFDLFGNPIP